MRKLQYTKCKIGIKRGNSYRKMKRLLMKGTKQSTQKPDTLDTHGGLSRSEEIIYKDLRECRNA